MNFDILDDRAITGDVFGLVHFDADNAMGPLSVLDAGRGHYGSGDHGHHSALFSVFLQVVELQIFLLTFLKIFKQSIFVSLRGFKTVGPFVVMIYRMLKGDLIRFVSIYLVFVMGFSQGTYTII
jgi:hypothetical protein